MTFDEQLRREVDTLTDRFRDELTQHVRATADRVATVARAERERIELQAREAADRAAAAAADAEARAYAYGKDEGRTAAAQDADAAAVRLAGAVQALDASRSLGSILETLVQQLATDAERLAVLLVRGEHLAAWRLVGFDAAGTSGAAPVHLDEGDIVGRAVKENAVTTTDGPEPLPAPAFAAARVPVDALCVPIALAGEVVAAVYVDRAAAAPQPAWRSRVEVIVRHAARCLEAIVAFKTARMLTDAPVDSTAVDASRSVSSEEETAARRYARLLVSEIRLYHEEAVAAGRRERDLATRLGGEIARARMLYEQRVTRRVRERVDYFQEELVRTLANGDAALLELNT